MPDAAARLKLPHESWRVEPLPPRPISYDDRSELRLEAFEAAGGARLAWLAVLVTIIVWIVIVKVEAPYPGYVVGAVLGIAVAVAVWCLLYYNKINDLQRARLIAAEEEAVELSSKLKQTLANADLLAVELERRQTNAASLLARARLEFAATAFAPFWDAVERCASELGAIRNGLQCLTNSATMYSSALKDRRHSFPALRRTFEVGPELRAVRTAFDDVVRKGQRDYQFATIWEHRMTRKAVIDGFKTLGETVERVSDAVYGAADSLQMTLRDGFAGVVAGQDRASAALDARFDAVDRIEEHTASTAAAARDVRRVIARYRLLDR